MNDPATRKRLTWLLLLGQSLGSAAFLTSSTVGALVGAQLSGQVALAGLPSATYQLGSALAAYPAAQLMARVGRRPGLLLGFTFGIVGALIAGFAVIGQNFIVFLIGFALMGLTRGFTDLARYAAAEMHPETERARAISLVVWGGTVGALTGPALAAPMGQVAVQFGQDPLAGPWFASAVLFVGGLALLFFFLRPDPSVLARTISREPSSENQAQLGEARPWRVILAQPTTQTAMLAMIIGQLVMVMIMVVTSLHIEHNHGGRDASFLGDVSFVLTAHTLGMFGLSIFTGRLTDRLGRPRTIVLGTVILIIACVLAPIGHETPLLAFALFLLGLGWNLCYVAGAALLTDSLNFAERAQMQGSNDLLVGLVSAAGSLQSGALFAVIGYGNLAWLALGLTLLPLGWALRLWLNPSRPVVTAEVS